MKDEITYTPGRLAKKLGISRNKLMRHLRKTELIDQCWLTEHGYWQIPYSIAVRISSAEALVIKEPRQRNLAYGISRRGQKHGFVGEAEVEGHESLSRMNRSPERSERGAIKQPNYAQIGKTLRAAGITMMDVIKYIEQQMEVTHEQSPYNSTRRDENKASEPATNGSASSDISDSSEQQ